MTRQNPRSDSDRSRERARDCQLMERLMAGDEQAFTEVYTTYFPRVYGFCLKRVGDTTEAEDLAQETFVQLYRSLASFEGRASLLTWTFGIAQNVCSRYFRHCSRWMVGPTKTHALDECSVESTLERRIDALRVLDHCDRVLASSRHPAHQEIFHLRYGQCHSIRVIAEKLGKTNDAVKISLRRSRAALSDGVPGLRVVLDDFARSA